MLAVTRYRVAESDGGAFHEDLRVALEALTRRPGFVRGHVARAADDAELWLLVTQWEGIGPYRRALSSYDVKVHAVPVMSRAFQEPSAFEVLVSEEAVARVAPDA